MTQPFNPAGDGQPAVPAPGATAAGIRPAGGTGPGVPLSIWPGLPAHDVPGGEPCGGPVTAAAARRVIDAFSLPGDLVAAAGGCLPAVTEAAAAAGRRVLALAAGPALPRRQSGGPAALPPLGDPAAGTAGLAIAGWRSPGCCGPRPGNWDGEPGPGPAFAACERVLRPGGVLAVIAGPAAPGGTLAGTAGSLAAAARAAGLVYAQHIVLVRAVIDGDRLAPADPGPGPAVPGGRPAHDDLLVFTKPGKPVSSAELKDPQPELPGRSRRSPAADPWVHGEDEGPVS
jgi:hypothetical protein